MYCGTCGTQNPDHAAFCSKCGQKMVPPIPVASPPPKHVAHAKPPSPPQQEASWIEPVGSGATPPLAAPPAAQPSGNSWVDMGPSAAIPPAPPAPSPHHAKHVAHPHANPPPPPPTPSPSSENSWVDMGPSPAGQPPPAPPQQMAPRYASTPPPPPPLPRPPQSYESQAALLYSQQSAAQPYAAAQTPLRCADRRCSFSWSWRLAPLLDPLSHDHWPLNFAFQFDCHPRELQ